MKKAVIISIAAVLILAGAAGFTFWKINDIKEKKELAMLEDIAGIQATVDSLYVNEQKTNLSENINNNQIQQSHNLIAEIRNKELSEQASLLLEKASADLNAAEEMLELKQSVAQLLDANGAIEEGADIGAQKSRVDVLLTEKPEFAAEMMVFIQEAEAQQNQIQVATKQVEGLFTSADKSTVRETVTQTEINDAKASVATIKQEKMKTSLLSDVETANVYLEAKLKAEAEAKAKAEAEAKAKAEAEAKAKAKAEADKEKSSSKKSSGKQDLTGWYPYSTGDPSLLLKYILSGEVVEYNGQYWASPALVERMSNPEIHVYEIGE